MPSLGAGQDATVRACRASASAALFCRHAPIICFRGALSNGKLNTALDPIAGDELELTISLKV